MKWRVARRNGPEHDSVKSHYYRIFHSKSKDYKYYRGMPFFDGWNPKKGGSTKAGADWIIKNLGKRPKGSQIHIIEHEKGFVPGNIEWTHPTKQSHQQMFKIIAQLRNRLKKCEERTT